MVCLTLTIISLTGCVVGSNETKPITKDDSAKDVKETSNFNLTGYPIVNEKISVSFMLPKPVIRGEWQELQYFISMEELTNIHIDFISIDDSVYQEKKNLMFASGDYPDVIFSLTSEEVNQYGVETRVLTKLNDLVENYSVYIKKAFAEIPLSRFSVTELDGDIYTLPNIVETLTLPGTHLYARTDYLTKANTKIPSTIDEFYNACKSIKSWNPDIIPLTIDSGKLFTNFMGTLIAAFGEFVDVLYSVDKDGNIVFVPTTDQFKNTLQYMNKLYNENLLDQDCFTQSGADATAKEKNNKTVFSMGGTSYTLDNFESGKYEVEIIPPMISSDWTTKHVKSYSPAAPNKVAFTNTLKYPEAIIRWFDVNYADQSVSDKVSGLYGISQMLGIEGKNWTYDKATNIYKRLVPSDTNLSETEYFAKKVVPGTIACKIALFALPDPSNPAQYMKASQCQKNIFPYLENGLFVELLKFTQEEKERIKLIKTDLETYVLQMEAKFVGGQESFSNWDVFQKTIKQIGADELISIYQKSYDRNKDMLR